MKIINYKRYRDGGTDELTTEDGTEYCLDGRIRSETKSRWYIGYPKSDNSNLIEDSKQLQIDLITALKDYKNDFYQKSIDYLIKELTHKNND